MKFTNYNLTSHQLKNSTEARTVWHLTLLNDQVVTSEIAPLSENNFKLANQEFDPNYEKIIHQVVTKIINYDFAEVSFLSIVSGQLNNQLTQIIPNLNEIPCLKYALEIAFLEYHKEFLDLNFTDPVHINATIFELNNLFENLTNLYQNNYRCFKIKLNYIKLKDDLWKIINILENFCINFPNVELRLDFNQTLIPDFKVIEKLAKIAPKINLQYLEQPFKIGDFTKNLREFIKSTNLKIALDEELVLSGNSLLNFSEKQTLLNNLYPEYLIIKPMLIGGIYEISEWINLCPNGTKLVFTSAMESYFGHLHLIRLIQFFQNWNNLVIEKFHGLSTYNYFDNQVNNTKFSIINNSAAINVNI